MIISESEVKRHFYIFNHVSPIDLIITRTVINTDLSTVVYGEHKLDDRVLEFILKIPADGESGPYLAQRVKGSKTNIEHIVL